MLLARTRGTMPSRESIEQDALRYALFRRCFKHKSRACVRALVSARCPRPAVRSQSSLSKSTCRRVRALGSLERKVTHRDTRTLPGTQTHSYTDTHTHSHTHTYTHTQPHTQTYTRAYTQLATLQDFWHNRPSMPTQATAVFVI